MSILSIMTHVNRIRLETISDVPTARSSIGTQVTERKKKPFSTHDLWGFGMYVWRGRIRDTFTYLYLLYCLQQDLRE